MFYETPRKKSSNKFKKYRDLIKGLTLTVEQYSQLKRAFAGGFTHANPFYSGDIIEDAHSFDETSAYPFVMVAEQFPMSSPIKVKITSKEQFYKLLKLYCCVFDATFENIRPKQFYENYISVSHCRDLKDYEENNGRIVQATELTTTITEQDFFIIEKFYEWDKITIRNFNKFTKAYLPKDLILSILELYKNKTELKDIVEFAVEYMLSKNMINSVFGMMVTDICRDEILYEEELWSTDKPDFDKAIEKYNDSVKRFLYYAWGVWVTAYARKNLFTGIYEFKDDYLYSDTDSLKVINIDNHMDYINKYNQRVRKKLEAMCKFYDIPIELTRPKNKKGEEKELGIWDYEGHYTRFKTLGAKRYLTEKYEKNKETGVYEYVLTLTVSGVNKKNAIKYLLHKYGREKVFEAFDDDLDIPAVYYIGKKEYSGTGKLTHTYIDDIREGYAIDYLGKKQYYKELSSVHLEDCEYSLSLSSKYVDFLLGIKQVTI